MASDLFLFFVMLLFHLSAGVFIGYSIELCRLMLSINLSLIAG